MVVEGEGPNKGKLAGIITLSDVLRYIVYGRESSGERAERLALSASAPITPAGSKDITPAASTPLSPAVESAAEPLA